mmetsp:Transcript_7401/g.13800  ORF Transcript_7401/g.13800 Transcript_7401/m.13800 type:complete len:121 (+) Transcript_7401:2801-3163(+)
MMQVNPILQEQLIALSNNLSETVSMLKIQEANLIALDTERRRNEISLSALTAIEDARARVYKPVGRTFFLMTKDELQTDLAAAAKRNVTEIAETKRKSEMLAKRRDEISTNIQELVASLK